MRQCLIAVVVLPTLPFRFATAKTRPFSSLMAKDENDIVADILHPFGYQLIVKYIYLNQLVFNKYYKSTNCCGFASLQDHTIKSSIKAFTVNQNIASI